MQGKNSHVKEKIGPIEGAPEDVWLARIKSLHAIASTGLFFGASEYDKERYAEIGEIAQAMLSDLTTLPLEVVAHAIPDYGQGYATPQVDVRGAVFQSDKILLVQEKSDQRWTLPGGYADVGLSAAENIVKEIQEEAGVSVKVTKLYAIRHKAKHPYEPDIRDFYKFFFLCRQVDEQPVKAGHETMDAKYFALGQLPTLSTGRVLEADLHLARHHLDNFDELTDLD